MFIDEQHFPVENIIFPVGQGGLFLGLIKYRESNNEIETKTFAYIYDCGNMQKTYLENSINNLIDILKITNEISQLTHIYIFISHVHNDHISGLKFLKQKLEKCKFNLHSTPVLVMPYMHKIEKKIVIKLNILDKRYTGILTNPYSYFDGYFDVQYLRGGVSYTNEQDIFMQSQYNYTYSIPKTKKISNSNPNIKIFKHNQNFRFEVHYGSWILKPFYYRFNIPNDLQERLQENGYKSIYDINFDNINKINNLLKKELKDKLNLSSLCLYSGLINNNRCGWMHTGDFNFKYQAAFEKFRTHYDSVLNNVQILQIPHHGSEKNSSNEDFEMFPNLTNKYVTMQENPNGIQQPKLSPEYINDKTIYLATENKRIKFFFEQFIIIFRYISERGTL